jgi:ureidoacrylate peracid hydrolase
MQRYYIDQLSPFHRYYSEKYPGSMDYIDARCRDVVVPAIRRVQKSFRSQKLPIVYFKLCGIREDRSDLHRFFSRENRIAAEEGYKDIYPIESDPFAAILPELAPQGGETVLRKCGFGGFTLKGYEERLRDLGVARLAFVGLATSQCVDTTARQASDLGFEIAFIEDGLADYSYDSHLASLHASRGTCGGLIMTSDEVIATLLT